MSAAPTTAARTTQPDPHQDQAARGVDKPSRTGQVLGLLRTLIDYGKRLAASLQHATPDTILFTVALAFTTKDVALILARITRGLQYAAALEAKLVARLEHEAKHPAATIPTATIPTASTPAPRKPHTADAPPQLPASPAGNPRLALLPSAEEIAAEVRRRPIGAVLADICRDLGIVAGDPLWCELNLAIMCNGGNATKLLKEMITRGNDWITYRALGFIDPMPPGWTPPPRTFFAAAHGTGPP